MCGPGPGELMRHIWNNWKNRLTNDERDIVKIFLFLALLLIVCLLAFVVG